MRRRIHAILMPSIWCERQKNAVARVEMQTPRTSCAVVAPRKAVRKIKGHSRKRRGWNIAQRCSTNTPVRRAIADAACSGSAWTRPLSRTRTHRHGTQRAPTGGKALGTERLNDVVTQRMQSVASEKMSIIRARAGARRTRREQRPHTADGRPARQSASCASAHARSRRRRAPPASLSCSVCAARAAGTRRRGGGRTALSEAPAAASLLPLQSPRPSTSGSTRRLGVRTLLLQDVGEGSSRGRRLGW